MLDLRDVPGGGDPLGRPRSRRVLGRAGTTARARLAWLRRRQFGVLAIVLLVALSAGGAYLATFPPVVTVMTSSMEPEFGPGDVLLMQSLHGRAPAVGDIVEVSVPVKTRQEHDYPEKVTHRVVKVAGGEVTTQGDNLGDPDPFTVPVSSVDRRVLTELPGAGRVIAFAFSPFGLLWIASGILLFFILPLRNSTEEIRLDLEELRRAPPVPPEMEQTNQTLAQLVGAVGEYGEHLQSHTAVVKAMSDAAQSLAAIVARLENQLATGQPLVPASVAGDIRPPETPEPQLAVPQLAVPQLLDAASDRGDMRPTQTQERPVAVRPGRPLRAHTRRPSAPVPGLAPRLAPRPGRPLRARRIRPGRPLRAR